MLFQQIVSGLAAGSLYALAALSLVLVFKASGVVNFAQGEMAMFTTFVCYILITQFKVPYVLAVLLTLAFAVLLGMGIERSVIRPLAQAPVLSIVIVTLGVNVTLHSAAGLLWGQEYRTFPSPFANTPFEFGGLVVAQDNFWITAVTLGLMVPLVIFFKFTSIGIATRALAQNQMAAVLMGISVKRVFALTWGMSSVAGAIAGILFAPIIYLNPNMMGLLLIKGFAAGVLGGFNSIPGVVLGGFLLGLIENLAGGYVSNAFKDTFAFILIIVVLLVRPTGLLGNERQKKV